MKWGRSVCAACSGAGSARPAAPTRPHSMRVLVVGTAERHHERASYTAYRIRVQRGRLPIFEIERRFSELKALHAVANSKYPPARCGAPAPSTGRPWRRRASRSPAASRRSPPSRRRSSAAGPAASLVTLVSLLANRCNSLLIDPKSVSYTHLTLPTKA
mgnify:CR=1 FL=1